MSHTRYEPARPRLQRSELAVPGSNPAMFPKALESEADYIFLDLEDAVAPADKVAARLHVIKGLQEYDWRRQDPIEERGAAIPRDDFRTRSVRHRLDASDPPRTVQPRKYPEFSGTYGAVPMSPTGFEPVLPA